MSGFDVVEHHRRRTREADRRADMLESEIAKAVRLLSRAVTVAPGNDCDPLALLAMLEELDRIVEKPEPSIDDLVEILRATDPDPTWRDDS